MRYFLCPRKTDMRKGMSSLCGVIHERMGQKVNPRDSYNLIFVYAKGNCSDGYDLSSQKYFFDFTYFGRH